MIDRHYIVKRALRRCLLMLSLLALSACQTSAYYWQLGRGQWSIYWQRQAVNELLQQDAVDPQLQQQLRLSQDIVAFAEQHMGLDAAGSFQDYVELGRPFPVWNVVAAAEFSVDARQWCFPIAGCVSYRGYFTLADAQAFAEQLRQQNWDVSVSGASAYSTLGWFDDPLLSSFIYWQPPRLAGLIFHELAHQRLYLPGDVRFNESYARAVELLGLEAWLAARQQSQQLAKLRAELAIEQAFVAMLLQLQRDLQQLYLQPIKPALMRRQKQQRLAHFRETAYPQFRQQQNSGNRFDGWVQQPLNNARLALVADYYQWLPWFLHLWQQTRDWPLFFQRVEQLAALPEMERLEYLQNSDFTLDEQ